MAMPSIIQWFVVKEGRIYEDLPSLYGDLAAKLSRRCRVLEVLFNAYNESSGFDSITTKADLVELHKFLDNRSMTEINAIISAVNSRCRNKKNWDLMLG